jgi:N-acylneuraminate cytidylyltransferase
MSKVVAIIPARSGSKGVLGKNIRKLGKLPLIAWSIEAAKKTPTIDRILVSTDSQEYSEIAIKYGAEAPFLRPPELSRDNSGDIEFIKHALDWLNKNEDYEPDYIVHLRPTTPFRNPDLIDKAVKYFIQSSHFTSLRSSHEMSESAYKTFEISSDGVYKRVGVQSTELDGANNARQEFPKTYQANGYVDILSVEYIRKTGLLHGNRVMPFITEVVTEVDSEDDFKYLEFQLSNDEKRYGPL